MRRYRDWIADVALPCWAGSGFDPAAGRFHERLGGDARPIDVPQRAMVQARQVYVFAHAALLGWAPEGGALAEAAMASLRRDFCDEGGGRASFAFSIGRDGRRIDETRDAYTHAFVLFALAWLYRLTGDDALLGLADRTHRFVEEVLVDRVHGGVRDAHPGAAADKRQNPQMHLLEAYLALEEAAPGRGYLERAGAVVSLFEQRLFDADGGVLREYFAADWSRHPDEARAHSFEPGHHLEWVWLLHQHERLTGLDLAGHRAGLAGMAHRLGRAPSGLIFDELAADGRVTKRSHRIWPHTEAIKAAATAHAEGDGGARAAARTMAELLARHFLDRPFEGGWIDHVSEQGLPLVSHVPASSLYHLFLAAAEADRVFAAEAQAERSAVPA